jgi:hypothetical protein
MHVEDTCFKYFYKVGIETLNEQVGSMLLLPFSMLHGILCTWDGTVVLLGDICHKCLCAVMLMWQQNKPWLLYK